jgi:[ribosomal protein S5]-alanine N-acetyltransferase
MYPLRLDGSRLSLREVTCEDLDATMAIVGDSDVMAHVGFDPIDRDTQAQLLAAEVERARRRPRSDYYLVVLDPDADTVVGLMTLELDPHRHGELGIMLRRDCWGRGFATEVCVLILDFAFRSLRLHRVQATCSVDHPASPAVLSNLGFHREGRLREYLHIDGRWRDSYRYSLLDHEWQATPPPSDRTGRETGA